MKPLILASLLLLGFFPGTPGRPIPPDPRSVHTAQREVVIAKRAENVRMGKLEKKIQELETRIKKLEVK